MWTHELEATFITYSQLISVSQWHFHGCKQIYLHWLSQACLTIDVSAWEAALQSLSQGKGCGRLVRERRQPLSFFLERRKNIKTKKTFSTFWFLLSGTTYLQTNGHEVHLQLPSPLVLRDTSHTHYPVTKTSTKSPVKPFLLNVCREICGATGTITLISR